MRQCAAFFTGRAVSRILIVTLVGGAVVGCGSDAGRFNENPFSNPFSGSARFDGGQAQQPAQQIAAVQPPMNSASNSTGMPSAASSAVSSAPLAAPGAAQIQSASSAVTRASGPVVAGWTANGGSAVTLGKGETLKTLSERYGVPETALRSANNISGNPAPGSSVVIPVYNASGAAAPVTAAANRAAPTVAAAVAPSAKAPIAAGKPGQLAAPTQTTPAQVAAVVPGAKPVAGKEPVKAEAAKPTQMSAIEATKPDPKALAKAQELAKIDPKTGKPDPKATAKALETAKADVKATAKEVETTASVTATEKSTAPSTEFRWPARGRVIQGFGNKAGQNNDGINIAVPEGTPVKAAEGGVVAYAGNELKGYGNLVLVRHDNGWVTAYAHNGELKVKRGEQVKRGQVVATSGQSGNVSSPQIHFELRKGSTPVDPMEHLSSN